MLPALHRTIVVFDVEGFGDRRRTNEHQIAVRAGLYRVLRRTFDEVAIPWTACDHEDRGDGVLMLATPDIPKSAFAEKLPKRLAGALREHNDGRRPEERIRLRMALHAGEIHYDDHGVTSVSINLAFRLLDAPPLKAALAESDGVLAVITSSWFFDEVVRHSTASIPSAYRPVRVAVKETVTVAWICLPGHSQGVPLSRRELELTPVMMRRTLPRDTADFTGRGQELAKLLTSAITAIETGQAVVIHAIDGMAGVGKTALAVHLGHLLADRFPDGQLFLRLHAHTTGQRPVDPALALASLLSAIGVSPRHIPAGIDERAAQWRDQLANRKMLMIFDDAAGHQQVEPLLPATPGCLALVTSRRRLSALEAAETLPLDTLPPDQAVALFHRLSVLATDAVDADHVAEIVRLAGYLPLAISLLASRLRHHPSWSVKDLITHLHSTRDRILDIRAEDIAIATAFDLSYRNLPAKERRFFRYLGLHPGPEVEVCSAAALANVSRAEAGSYLEALYSDHLLDEFAPGRYRMHDLVRDYAGILTRRIPLVDREKAIERLFDHYQEAVDDADSRIHGNPTQDHDGLAYTLVGMSDLSTRSQALSWMNTEFANVLACVEYAARHGHHERVIRLARSMNSFGGFTGPWDQAISLHRLAAEAGQSRGDPRTRAYSLNQLGELWRMTGHFSDAIDAHTEALEIYRSLDTQDVRKSMAATISLLGCARMTLGDLTDSINLHSQALEMFRELDSRLGEAVVLNELAITLRFIGRHREACNAHEQALAIYGEFGNVFGKAFSLYGLGTTYRAIGALPRAAGLQEQALEIYRSLDHRVGEADSLNELGLVRGLVGDMHEANEMHARALEIYHDIGHPLGQAETMNNKGELLRAKGEYRQAKVEHQSAVRLARRVHSPLEEARALDGIGECDHELGDADAAVTALQQATSLYKRMNARRTSTAANRLAEIESVSTRATPDQGAPRPQQWSTRHPR